MSTAPTFNLDAVCEKYQLNDECRAFLERLRIDPSQQEAISNYDQRTPEWLQSRQGRITASRFGAARGHCPYTSQKKLLHDLLWGEFFTNAAMQYGVDHEPIAVDKYTQFMKKQFNLSDDRFQVTHCGLWVPVEYPWVGVSVDGFVFDDAEEDVKRKRGGVEIKCPYGKKLYPFIPSMYYDQIQGSMGFLQLPWWDFVVYTASQIQIRRVEFDAQYFQQELFPRLESFYMTEYLPRMIAKAKGELSPTVSRAPVLHISCDDVDRPEKQPDDEEPSRSRQAPVADRKDGHFSLASLLR